MNKVFKEYYKLDDDRLKHFWDDALIVFDTNVLLNFYRYSENTISELLNVLEMLGERLWIPYQIGKEFHQERLNVIQQQIKVYNDSISNIHSIEEDFSNNNRNPFLSEKLFSEFSNILLKVNEELKEKTKVFTDRILQDDLLPIITSIFNDKVGKSFSDEELSNIYKLGKIRYENKVPPGYQDANKPEPQKYGDLVIWKQILEKAKEDKKDIIYVTDERKDDWWYLHSGKIIMARPELRKEFFHETNQQLFLYQPFKFLEQANNSLKVKIDENTIAEVKELRPLKESTNIIDKNLLITASVKEISDNSNINGFIEYIITNGYEVHWNSSKDLVNIYITIPNIPDLARRIKKRVFSRVEEYGYQLVDFNPDFRD